jgi:DNA-binding response OmpR family regulator
MILLANDYPPMLRLLSRVIEIEGFRVIGAHDDAAALELASKTAPLQLIILGLEAIEQSIGVCRHIRQFSDVPIIIVAANYEAHDRAGSLAAGANDLITLPVSMDEFATRFKALLPCPCFPKTEVPHERPEQKG